jgi:hypothetical protein
MKDYFAILQVPENSSPAEIQKAYRQLALRYHPDVNKSPDAHEKFCEITEAYEFLMNHWPQHVARYPETSTARQKYAEYRHTDDYERFRRETREKAQQQARMRYEKFKKQHEAFQESGINDIALLFTAFIRLLSIPMFLGLALLPIVLAFVSWQWIFMGIVMWPVATIIGWYMHDNRRHYMLPGTFYYSPSRLRHLFTDTHPSDTSCYYCSAETANSKPFHLDLLKLKDLKISTGGYRQHNVNYINRNITILVPRSRKAFIIHSLNGLVKILSIIGCMFFFPVSSIVWRMLAGMVLGGLVATIMLAITRTRSNVSYLFSTSMILRLAAWLISLLLASRITFNPFDIQTTDAIHFVITAILVFDSLLMQLIEMVVKKSTIPLFSQYPDANVKFAEGYRVYNDVPLLSVVYPLFKWIFG